eukprot:4950906-Amphidinium_carterae.1
MPRPKSKAKAKPAAPAASSGGKKRSTGSDTFAKAEEKTLPQEQVVENKKRRLVRNDTEELTKK